MPANPQIQYKGVFGRHDFPNYVYQEYPKAMKLANGKQHIVGSLREELDFRAKQTDIDHGPEPTAHPIESERNELAAKLAMAQAEAAAKDDQLAKMQAQLDVLMAGRKAAAVPQPPPLRDGAYAEEEPLPRKPVR
jgi:hypothetical protein